MINVIYNLHCKVVSFATEKKVDKTIISKYPSIFKINELREQIVEMKNFICKYIYIYIYIGR